MVIIHGFYRFQPRRVAFRNDYCLSCGQARRAVQVRTFVVLHLFWIPLVPLGFWKRWSCTVCHRDPHASPKTRRSYKWAGLVVLLFFSVFFWAMPVEPDFVAGAWLVRVAAPLGAVLLFLHLLRTPQDPSLNEKLATVLPAQDLTCPFCGTPLVLGPRCSCPVCGVVRR